MLAGQGPEAGRLDWLGMADGREMKGSDSRPRPASACPHPALIHPSSYPSDQAGCPRFCLGPRPLSVKAAEIQVKAVSPGQGPATLTAPRTVSPSQLFGKLDLFTCSKLP